MWVYGPPRRKPCRETDPRWPITDYGRKKVVIETELWARHAADGFPASIVHPGHISAPEWQIVNPRGALDDEGIYDRLARGEPVLLPDGGQSTLTHVHADDVGQMIQLCIDRQDVSIGEAFNTVAPRAVTLVGCCECVAALSGREPVLEFLPMGELASHMSEEAFDCLKTHAEHAPCGSIDKARDLLGYEPAYTTEQIFAEYVATRQGG
jgi:nucleoside-diphosphate-sugar epimerase